MILLIYEIHLTVICHYNSKFDTLTYIYIYILIICFWWISQKVALITIKLDLITESMGGFSGGGLGGLNSP